MAPRGHGKTTVVTVSEITRRLLADPDRRVLLASNTHDQAQAIYRMIRDLLSKVVVRDNLFVNPVDRARAGELWMRRRRKIHKEASLTALGVFGPITLRHFDDIFVDDAIDFENTRSAAQRRKFKEWVGMTLLPTLEPGGSAHWVGTRYHSDDFYGAELLDKGKYPGLVWNRGTHRALLEDGRAIWPERFGVDELQAVRRQVGPAIFAAQYMNDASLMQGMIFRHEWFRYFNEPPQELAVYAGFDPAISQKEQADFSALVVLGRKDQDLFVLDAMRGHWTFEEQVRVIGSAVHKWRPLVIGIEDVAYQRALIETCRRMGMPVVAVNRRVDKVARAYAIQGHFESGRIRFPSGGRLNDLQAELLVFPEGEHDDLFDALEMAIEQALKSCVDIFVL